jgi:hypothetical protein
MFDEIPKPDRSRGSRKLAWLWIGLSALWLVIGARGIKRHDEFGWPLVVMYPIVLAIWIRRLVMSYRDDAQ